MFTSNKSLNSTQFDYVVLLETNEKLHNIIEALQVTLNRKETENWSRRSKQKT
jgi:hypothetical protein